MTACDRPPSRRFRLAPVGLVALTLALGGASPARAQAPRAAISTKAQTKRDAEHAKQAAQQHLERGNELFTRDEIPGALAEFQAAFDLYPSPKLHFNLGQCERALGHNEAAAAHFERFLAEAPDVRPELRAEAERYLAEARTPAVPASEPPPPPAPPIVVPIAKAPPAAVPVLTAPPPRRAEPVIAAPPAPPVYARWWFWAAVGAVVVGGAVTAYALSRPRDPECGAGMECL